MNRSFWKCKMQLPKLDYTFSFGSIQSQNIQVTQTNHSMNNESDGFTITLHDNTLWINGFSPRASISADLLDLAVAIHAVDRLIERPRDKTLSFHIKIQVRNLDLFSKNDVGMLLNKILHWYTDDHWHFEFSKQTIGRQEEIQYRFPTEDSFAENADVVLWSGGLDSLAGLYTQLDNDPESRYILVGTGSNAQVHAKQTELAKEMERLFPKRILLQQVPYSWSNTPSPEKNFYARSRGFVFMLIGAAFAHCVGRNSLFIYENGIGAMNLPYSRGQSRSDQAISVHPLSVLYVNELVSTILSTSFEVLNPFWLYTKAQMVESLNHTKGLELIKLSSSCDRHHRKEGGITQCGICTSCLLRRQSIIAAGIDDPTIYDSFCIPGNGQHLCAMTHQINTLRKLLNQDDPWLSLSGEYYDLDNIVGSISREDTKKTVYLKEQILQLYSKYKDEWKLFEEYIERTN